MSSDPLIDPAVQPSGTGCVECLAADPPGTPLSDPNAHGNGQLRAGAFLQGYDAGSWRACSMDNLFG